MRKPIAYILLIIISLTFGCKQDQNLESILGQGSPEFQEILKNPSHEIQIVYGRIINGQIEHEFFGDTSRYFYPASSVKMLAAFAAVQKLDQLNLPLETKIKVDSTEHHPRTLQYDSLFNEAITIENLIKKIFVYSDNQAFNVLYGWLGKDYINGLYKDLGIEARITHQLSESAFSFTDNANASRTSTSLESDGQLVKSEDKFVEWTSSLNPDNQLKGVGYLKGGELVGERFDFSRKNFVPLAHLLGSLERIVYPDKTPSSFEMRDGIRNDLLRTMKLLPEDLPNPIDTLGDNYVKFFMYGDQKEKDIPDSIQILNKVGWAYGYLTDVAYILDKENDIEFFLAATIHVNENQVYNDGVYEYEEIGLPFLGELGRIIYNFELSSSS